MKFLTAVHCCAGALMLGVAGLARASAEGGNTTIDRAETAIAVDAPTEPVKANPKDSKGPQRVQEVVVVGNPLGGDARDVALPVSVLSGNDLLLKRGGTLGETVSGLPGVSSTWFGPNAGRPVIRGLDGDRVRVLSNLGASLDASNLSYDHNPAIDSLVIQRVEVLRGPSALLYGGTAIGGVVNVIDGRIAAPTLYGVEGALETRYGGAERERSNAARVQAGNGAVMINIDGFERRSDDYRVPGATGRVSPIQNSSAEAHGGAVAASVAIPKGYVGLAHTTYQSDYGVIAEPNVRIDMHQTRNAFEMNLSELGGAIDGIFVKASKSVYQHVEVDAGVVATRFNNEGHEIRAEAKHARWGGVQGVVGVTSERFRFSALGDEAFVPATATRNTAIFIFEEWQSGAGKYSFGVRRERSEVDSAGAGAGGVTRFGAAASKSFALSGLSASAQWKLDEAWSVATNFSVAERAPTYYELFANGPHAATAAYEVGDDRLSPEKSRGLDLGLRWKQGESSARVGYFLQSFDRFLFLNRTGVLRDAEGNQRVNDCGDGTSVESACAAEILPEYQYVSRKAQLRGWELDVAHRLVERSASSAFTVDVSAKLDITRATDQTTGRPLPRIAPLRTILGATLGVGQFTGRLEVERAGRQDRVPLDDAIGPTAAFTLFNSSMLYTVRQGRYVSTFFIKGSNLTNRVAFNASSIDTIRSLAPLPGRSLKAGVRIEF